MCFWSACSCRWSRCGTRVRLLVSECLSALALPPLRNLSVPKTMVPVAKASMHFCGCHNTAVSKFRISVQGGILLLVSNLFGVLWCLLLRCGRVNFYDESKGGGSKNFPCHVTKAVRRIEA
jgi:hypothetical protein